MKKYKVKCPICSKIDTINDISSYQCSYCKHSNNIQDFEIINIKDENRDINYIKRCLEKSIIASDDKKIEYYSNILAVKDDSDYLHQYLILKSEDKKVEFLLKTNLSNEELYFIIKFLVIKDKKISKENKEILINLLKNNEQINQLMKYINKNEEDDLELFESLINEKIEVIEYKDLNKDKYVGIFFLIISIIMSILITLICNLIVYDDCVYATTIVLGILPSISLAYSLNKLCKIKNNILKGVLFIVVFYVLTYLMTIIYRDGSFIDSFYEHLKGIINAIPDILESITKHADIERVEGE